MTAGDNAVFDDSKDVSPSLVVEGLRKRLRTWERSSRQATTRRDEIVSSGAGEIDRLLPERGFPRGTLVEWLGEAGSGAGSLAWLAAREAARDAGWIVVVDPARAFYPPATVALGIDPARLLVARPKTDVDALWTLDQALRCPGVAAVWSRRDRLAERDFRRLQLAAEEGGTLGLFVRPAHAAREPSWAWARWMVRPIPSAGDAAREARASRVRRFEVEALRAAGVSPGAKTTLEWQEGIARPQRANFRGAQTRESRGHEIQTSLVPTVSALAAATPSRRASGA